MGKIEVYTARVHHILNFGENGGYEPGLLAMFAGENLDDYEEIMRRVRIYAVYILGSASMSKTPGYFCDVAGTTPKDRSKYAQKVCNALYAYATLPDHNIAVVQCQPDIFCKCTTQGDHCDKKRQSKGDKKILPELDWILENYHVSHIKNGDTREMSMAGMRTLCREAYSLYK